MSADGKSAGQSTRGYHRLVTLDECARRYAFRYGLRLEPRRSADALALGSLLHLACMARYDAMTPDGVLGDTTDPSSSGTTDPIEAMRCAPARIAHMYGKAAEVWHRYTPWADTEDAAWRVLAVEREWRARMAGHLITIRADLVVQDAAGAVLLINHKSAGGDLSMEIRAQAGKGQIALEELFCERVIAPHYGAPSGGVWINAISTSGAEPVAQRGRARVQPAWRDAVTASLVTLVARAAAMEARPGWGTVQGAFGAEVSPEACQGRWAQSRCSYFDLCREGPRALDTRGGFDSVIDNVTLLREASGA